MYRPIELKSTVHPCVFISYHLFLTRSSIHNTNSSDNHKHIPDVILCELRKGQFSAAYMLHRFDATVGSPDLAILHAADDASKVILTFQRLLRSTEPCRTMELIEVLASDLKPTHPMHPTLVATLRRLLQTYIGSTQLIGLTSHGSHPDRSSRLKIKLDRLPHGSWSRELLR